MAETIFRKILFEMSSDCLFWQMSYLISGRCQSLRHILQLTTRGLWSCCSFTFVNCYIEVKPVCQVVCGLNHTLTQQVISIIDLYIPLSFGWCWLEAEDCKNVSAGWCDIKSTPGEKKKSVPLHYQQILELSLTYLGHLQKGQHDIWW